MVIYILWLRQLKRYIRSKSRIIGSLGQPMLFLIALGYGLGPIFQKAGEGNYIEFLAPGIIAMSILFTSIFSGIEIIWDRQFGFLKEIMVAPVSRFVIMIGRTFGRSNGCHHPGNDCVFDFRGSRFSADQYFGSAGNVDCHESDCTSFYRFGYCCCIHARRFSGISIDHEFPGHAFILSFRCAFPIAGIAEDCGAGDNHQSAFLWGGCLERITHQ